jgi:hypothetical protein
LERFRKPVSVGKHKTPYTYDSAVMRELGREKGESKRSIF